MFRCISDSKLPIMLHTVFPEPHTGFSGFYHFKMWLHFVKLAHSADLTLCGFSTDSCSTGIAAARLLMTPSAEFIEEFGVTYLGLPHSSYKYYSVFLHIENEKEMEQDRQAGIMWNPKRGNVSCCFCLQSFYDSSTGLIIKCRKCCDAYHQNCHTPTLGENDFGVSPELPYAEVG